jgi:hypothetical protein
VGSERPTAANRTSPASGSPIGRRPKTSQGALRFTSGIQQDSQGTLTATASVPEPASGLVVASGLAAAIARRASVRRRV